MCFEVTKELLHKKGLGHSVEDMTLPLMLRKAPISIELFGCKLSCYSLVFVSIFKDHSNFYSNGGEIACRLRHWLTICIYAVRFHVSVTLKLLADN
jgi:hypothetical protein